MSDDVDAFYAEMGRRVRRSREAGSWTQAQLAHRLGMSRASVANLEGGRQRIPIHVLFQLADLLREEPFDLLPRRIHDVPRLLQSVELPADLPPSTRAFIEGCLDTLG